MTDYTIRRSPRARHVWLRFDQEDRLVVIVPRGFNTDRVPHIVASHQRWIAITREKIEARRLQLQELPAPALPDGIDLPATGGFWHIEYRATPSPRLRVNDRHKDTIVISGPVEDTERCRAALMKWLRRVAHAHLSCLAEQMASDNGFRVGRIIIRSQRTRWASCSARGTISLNVRLLFLAPELVRHVMLHELCHTKHMSHSRQFWTCVARHDPDWQEHKRRLRSAWHKVPGWLDYKVAPMNPHANEPQP